MGRGLQPHWGTRGGLGEGLLGFRGHHGELGAGGRADPGSRAEVAGGGGPASWSQWVTGRAGAQGAAEQQEGGSEDAESISGEPPPPPTAAWAPGFRPPQGNMWKLWAGRHGFCGCGQAQAQLAGLRRVLGLELDGAWPVSCRDRARDVTGRGGRRALQVDRGRALVVDGPGCHG